MDKNLPGWGGIPLAYQPSLMQNLGTVSWGLRPLCEAPHPPARLLASGSSSGGRREMTNKHKPKERG